MTYLEKIINEHENSKKSYSKTLTSLLLWRGFLVWTDEQYVYLHEGSTQSDVACFARIAAELNMMFDESAGKVGGAFLLQKQDRLSVSETAMVIFKLSNGHTVGWTAAPLENEVAFFKTAFGAKANTVKLDSGVALLVKTIPRIACRTWISCDGHHLLQNELATLAGRRPVRCFEEGVGSIGFSYELDRLWFEYAIERVVDYLKLDNFFSRYHPDGSYAESPGLYIAAQHFPAETFEERCFLRDKYLNKVGIALMNDMLVNRIRKARPRCTEEAGNLFCRAS